VNQKQEKALFGNVLPEGPIEGFETMLPFYEAMGLSPYGKHNIFEIQKFFDIARSQRDAIGVLIEIAILYDPPMRDLTGSSYYIAVPIILSAVIQDTWEEVKKAWEVEE
jgi:hypothetical protein